MNVGEADGHYEGYAKQMVHASADRREQFGHFEDEFEFFQQQIGGKTTGLMSDVVGSHYWARSGLFTVIGAEVAQGLPSSQMGYSFLRGAAKQYGTLLIGNPSTCGRFGNKCYNGTTTPTVSRDSGCLVSTMQRAWCAGREVSPPTLRSATAAAISCSRTGVGRSAARPSACCAGW